MQPASDPDPIVELRTLRIIIGFWLSKPFHSQPTYYEQNFMGSRNLNEAEIAHEELQGNIPSSESKTDVDYADPHLAAFGDNPVKPQELTLATFMAVFVYFSIHRLSLS